MSRRKLHKSLAGAALGLCRGGVGPAAPAAAADRPNIILIVTDDQDAHSLRHMAQVRRELTQQGMSFSNCCASSPGCSPSRASILRGQYPHNHGVWFSSPPDGGYPTFHERDLERSTLATWLQEKGYRTALVGKYMNEYGLQHPEQAPVPPGWDEWYASTTIDYFDYVLVENGKVVEYGRDPEDYLTDVLTAKAVSFVNRSARGGKPFFLLLAPRAPHDPATPAPRHEDAFANIGVPKPPSFDEPDVQDKPSYVRNSPRLNKKDVKRLTQIYRDRLRTLLSVDQMVAELFQALRRRNALEETYVFFTSDHGFLLGEHRRAEKGLPYEEAIRVPLLVRGPGVRQGISQPGLASNIDLAPTIAELAGATVPDFVDGRSLVPLLRGEAPASWRQAVLVEEGGRNLIEGAAIGTNPPNPPFLALRQAEEVFIEYPRAGERELYDLRADPHQLKNLAGGVEQAGELDDRHAWLEALRVCGANSRCRDVEDQPLASAVHRTKPDPVPDGGPGADRSVGNDRERNGRAKNRR